MAGGNPASKRTRQQKPASKPDIETATAEPEQAGALVCEHSKAPPLPGLATRMMTIEVVTPSQPTSAIHSQLNDVAPSKEEAERQIIKFALSTIKRFTIIEKRQIIKALIGKLRNEMACESTDEATA